MTPWRAVAADLSARREATELARAQAWRREGLISDRTLWDLVEAGADRFGDSRFRFEGERETDLATLAARARRIAGGLAGLGVREGDVVLIQSPSWEVAILGFWAALALGAVTVPVVHIYGPTEVGEIARRSGARALILPQEWRGAPLAERRRAMGPLPDARSFVAIGGAGSPDETDWTALEQDAAPKARPGPGDVRPGDVAALLYTSGTTAAPKGVLHTHRSIAAEVLSMPRIFPTQGRPTFLNALPAGHVAAFAAMLRPVVYGTHTVFLERWDATRAADLIRRHGVTVSTGTPFHLAGLLDAGLTGANSPLASYLTGGASVPPALVERAWGVGIRAFRLYGSTEIPTVSSGSPDEPAGRCALTDGRAMPGVGIRIAGADRPGAAGEVECIGPELCLGYTDPAENAAAFTPDGWFRTGDIGTLDAEGWLTIVDRKKDIIIRGGENISSREVEDVLARHAAVAECAAVGAPDPRYGERVAVFVRLRPGARLDLDAIRAHFAAAGVARQKTPEALVVMEDDFPRNGTGKIVKAALRARLRP